MNWHLIEGAEGCAYAVEHECVAIVVDALRASATAAMLLENGATEILVVREVDDALAAKRENPDALLYGERGGVPPEGFDYGNSPLETGPAKGRSVIFTTTTGAQRLNSAWGAHAAFMGTTVNAMAVAEAVMPYDRDVVLIPAGKIDDPESESAEDLAAAAAIAMIVDPTFGEGALLYRHWRARIENEGLATIFRSSPHGQTLIGQGFERDVDFCAKMNQTDAAPKAERQDKRGVVLVRAT